MVRRRPEAGSPASDLEQSVRRALLGQDWAGELLQELPEGQLVAGLERLLDEPRELLSVLSEAAGVPAIDFRLVLGDPMVLPTISGELALRLQAMPLYLVGNRLTVAFADPNDLEAVDAVRFASSKEVDPVVALPGQLAGILAEAYGAGDLTTFEEIGFEDGEVDHVAQDGKRSGLVLGEVQGDRPVVRLVNMILSRALHEGASDVHIEPQESAVAVRLRIDGRLVRLPFDIPRSVAPALVSRVKVIADLDIAQHRMPQDGKLRLTFRGRRVDVRVSTFPTIRGEKVVLRLLDKEKSDFRLGSLGFSESMEARWRRLLRRPEGLILVTGPTGSGKSSTLYASLRELNEPAVNIVTLEDPVEYELAGVSQAQVGTTGGLTFASGLRSILRQDPDIVLVGEIRDAETATYAVRAALTGHLVLASVHTNDAPSTVGRMLDLGISRSLLSACLLGVLAQRLLRRVCAECAGTGAPDPEAPGKPQAGRGCRLPAGCPACSGRGYRGRLAVFELLEMDHGVQSLISRGESAQELEAAARTYRRMWHDGEAKVLAGETTYSELASWVDRDTEGGAAEPEGFEPRRIAAR